MVYHWPYGLLIDKIVVALGQYSKALSLLKPAFFVKGSVPPFEKSLPLISHPDSKILHGS